MLIHAAENSSKALYAASFSLRGTITILKTTDGSNWTNVKCKFGDQIPQFLN